jgi:methyl-accepting chemotaxis protein
MKLRTKLTLVSVFILLLDGLCHVSIGGYVITNILYNLNRNLLASELHTRVSKFAESHALLKDSGVQDNEEYIASTQKDELDDLKDYRYGNTGEILIIGPNGKIIFHQNGEDKRGEIGYTGAHIDEMVSKKNGSILFTQGGENRYAAYEAFPEWNWVVALSVSTKEMLEMRSQYLQRVSIIALFILLLNSFMLRRFGRSIADRVGVSLDVLKKVQAGDLSVRIPDIEKEDEIGALQIEINSMISVIEVRNEQLASAKDRLEIRVEERTREVAEKSLELKEQLRNSSNLLNSMKQVVFAINQDGTIVPPVSKSAENVFDSSIEGKNVIDAVYKDLDKKSEAFTSLTTGLSVVFGDEELQWELTEPCFPRQVKYLGNGCERTLRFSYSPMWNDRGQLDRIMLVIEDITSMVELEKKVAAATAATVVNMEMVQELGKNESDDLDTFFSSALRMLEDSRAKVRSRSSSALSTCKRNLHTLKGNSRIFGLSRISAVTHEAETRMNNLQPGMRFEVEVILAEVGKSVFEYADVARRIHRLENRYYETSLFAVHAAAARADFVISEFLLKQDDERRKAVEQSLSELAIAARGIGAGLLVSRCELLAARFSGNLETEWNSVSDLARSTQADFSVSHWLMPDVEAWSTVFAGFYRCASLVKKGEQEGYSSAFESLAATCSAIHLDYLSNLSKWLAQVWRTPEFLAVGMDSAWRYLRLVSMLHSAYVLGQDKPDAQFSGLILGSLSKTLGAEFESFFTLSGSGRGDWHCGLSEVEPLRPLLDELLGNGTGIDLDKFLLEASASATRPGIFLAAFLGANGGTGISLRYLRTTEIVRLFKPCFLKKSGSVASRSRLLEVTEEGYKKFKTKLSEILARKPDKEIEELCEEFEHLADVPVKPALQKMTTMVTDIAGRLGKKVEFKVGGEDVALSRDRLNVLNDALVHLIRNSLDHGFEDSWERRRIEKREDGELRIDCTSSGRDVVVKVRDDGRGVDTKALIKIALEHGLLSRAQAESLSDEEALNLMFIPGLSTSSVVTEISGRGIGMTAVKEGIESAGGSIVVSSTLGKGTEVTIRLNTDVLSRTARVKLAA